METITVSNRREFIDEVMDANIGDRDEPLPLSKEGADELWTIWSYRLRNGAGELLVFVPEWIAENDYGRRWPYLFCQTEYDDDSKGAVLFRDIRMVDPSIVEGGYWSDVTMDDVLAKLDISDENDYVDDPGKAWIARSMMTVFEYEEETDDE